MTRNVAGRGNAGSYSPPTGAPYRPAPRAVGAAAALQLLECDASKVVGGATVLSAATEKNIGASGATATASIEGNRRGGRSAAALARLQYEEALQSQRQAAAREDLLHLDSPAASSAEPSEPALLQTAIAAAVGVAAEPWGKASLETAPEGGDIAAAPGSCLWPGDTVLAKYNVKGDFYRARIVRVYSRGGCSLADVEWLRPPQAEAVGGNSSGSGLYLTLAAEGGANNDLRRQGLRVDADIQRLPPQASHGNAMSAAPVFPQSAHAAEVPLNREEVLQGNITTATDVTAAVAAKAAPSACVVLPRRPQTAGQASALPDLLDLGSPLAPAAATAPAAGATPYPWSSGFSSGGTLEGSATACSGVAALAGSVCTQAAAPQERFDFVSDLIYQATAAGPAT